MLGNQRNDFNIKTGGVQVIGIEFRATLDRTNLDFIMILVTMMKIDDYTLVY